MMKWGKKKASTSLSTPPLINHVFPTSWLKKFKLKSGNAKAKQKGKLSVTSLSPSLPANLKDGRFYGGIDDLYWRLSFGDESFEVEKGTGGVRSVWCDSDDDLEVPVSGCNSWRSKSRNEDNQRFKDMVSEMRKMRAMEYNVGIMQEKDGLKGTKATNATFKAPNEQAMIDQDLRALNHGVLKEKKADTKRGSMKSEEEALQSAEKNIIDVIPGRTIQMKDEFQKSSASNSRRQRSLSCPSHSLRSIKEDRIFESLQQEVNSFSEEEFSSEWQKLKDMKIKEIRPKNDSHRKSVYISRGNPVKGRKVNTRIKAYSPRTAAKNECKIKALEDMKKAKKMRKKMKERGVEHKTAFDSYAVVKSSFDPQRDFRDSMLEMIIEKGIKRPEELEELLVCYLTLNCGEYHDLIIKVFRQVWFELNQGIFWS